MSIVVAVIIFGLLVAIHEFGHFIIAKANGIAVTEFSIGMGPRLFSFEKGGTRYSLKLLPIGGSCMMLGEGTAVEEENAFNKKNVWKRISVIFAGPFFNFILSFICAMVIIGIIGYDPAIVMSVDKNGPGYETGIKAGDTITKINGKRIHMGRELATYFEVNGVGDKELTFEYLHEGEKNTAKITPVYVEQYLLGLYYNGSESMPAMITSVTKGGACEEAGIVAGDVIIEIDGVEIKNGADIATSFAQNPLSDTPVNLKYSHEGTEHEVTLTPRLATKGYSIGFAYNYSYRLKTNLLGVIKYSFYEINYWISYTVQMLGKLITLQVGTENLGGPVRIVSEIGNVVEESKSDGPLYVVLNLLNWTLLLSANLGVMNLLPVPALDGGRLLFLAIEAVRGKPIDPEKEGIIHLIGFVLLMILMVFVFYNDIRNVFFK